MSNEVKKRLIQAILERGLDMNAHQATEVVKVFHEIVNEIHFEQQGDFYNNLCAAFEEKE